MEERKQNILIVHNYYQIPGGEDTVVANEKKMLEDHGHKVILYTRNNSELKEMSKFQKLKLPFTTIFNPRTYKDIKRIIRKENIDVVHVHNTLNLVSPAVYYAALSCKLPVVQTVHNFRLLCPGATFYRDGHICEDCVHHGLKCAIKHNCYRGSKAQTLVCVVNTWIHRMTGVYGKINYICLTEFNKQKLLELKQNVLEAERNVDRTKKESRFNASVNASIGFNQVAENFGDVYHKPMQQDLVAVSVSIPLLDWGVRKGKYNMARNNLNVVKISARQDEISIEEEVIMTVSDFNIQQQLIASAEEALDLAILAYNETRQRFIIGKADINSLTLSLNRQQEAQRNYISALQNYWLNYYKIRRLTLFDFATKLSLSDRFDFNGGRLIR